MSYRFFFFLYIKLLLGVRHENRWGLRTKETTGTGEVGPKGKVQEGMQSKGILYLKVLSGIQCYTVTIKQNKPAYDNKSGVRASQSGLDFSPGRGNLCFDDT